jgi:hypothetical protein
MERRQDVLESLNSAREKAVRAQAAEAAGHHEEAKRL